MQRYPIQKTTSAESERATLGSVVSVSCRPSSSRTAEAVGEAQEGVAVEAPGGVLVQGEEAHLAENMVATDDQEVIAVFIAVWHRRRR